MKTRFFLLFIGSLILLISTSTTKKDPLQALDSLKDFVEIPSGKVWMENTSAEVNTFYILRYEVTNQQYQAFLEVMKARGDQAVLDVVQIKTNKPQSWKRTPLVSDTTSHLYHTYKGYANFPVLNVSYEAATLYCKWLTEKVAKENDTDLQITFRLPTREEWMRAARGYQTHSTYVWGTPYLNDRDGKYLCNFKRMSAEQIHFNAETATYEIVPPSPEYNEELADGQLYVMTDAVDMYPANDFGLYNMCGNVAEMVNEAGKAVGGSWNDAGYDVRIESIQDYNGASPYVGFRPVMIVQK